MSKSTAGYCTNDQLVWTRGITTAFHPTLFAISPPNNKSSQRMFVLPPNSHFSQTSFEDRPYLARENATPRSHQWLLTAPPREFNMYALVHIHSTPALFSRLIITQLNSLHAMKSSSIELMSVGPLRRRIQYFLCHGAVRQGAEPSSTIIACDTCVPTSR